MNAAPATPSRPKPAPCAPGRSLAGRLPIQRTVAIEPDPNSGPDRKPAASAWMRWLVWGFGPAMFFYAFFQRVAPSVMIDPLMRELAVGGAVLGNLSALYFYVYAGMQIPVGLLIDRFGPRLLLTLGAGVCAGGAALFSIATGLATAYAGRLLVGLGASVGFVGALKLATVWLPGRRFALASGLLMMAGMLGGILGQAPLATAVEAFGWRPAMLVSALAGLLLAAGTWLVVRDRAPGPRTELSARGGSVVQGLGAVLRSRDSWLLALACASMTAPLLAFAGLWGVAWLMQVHAMTRPEAAGTASLLLLGWALGSPLAGALSDRIASRRWPLGGGLVMGATCLASIVFGSIGSTPALAALFFVSGACFGTMVLGFALVRECHPPHVHGAAFGFLNASVVATGAVFQPLIGALLDAQWLGQSLDGAPVYGAGAYRIAFSALLAFLALGFVALLALREPAPRGSKGAAS